MERETGFEPATSTLARSHSTTELFPLATNLLAYHSDFGRARIEPPDVWRLRGRALPARVAQHLRRFLRRRRVEVEPGRPLEAGHLRQLRNDLHVPVVEVAGRLGQRRACGSAGCTADGAASCSSAAGCRRAAAPATRIRGAARPRRAPDAASAGSTSRTETAARTAPSPPCRRSPQSAAGRRCDSCEMMSQNTQRSFAA